MKNEIESLNLLYGITVYNIIRKYEEFKTLNIKKISSTINNYFIWLENQTNINCSNVVYIGEVLFENKDIRQELIRDNIEKMYSISRKILKKINFADINKLLINEGYQNLTFEDYSIEYDNDNIQEILKDTLYSCNLIYKDLILLLINNFDFPKRLSNLYDEDCRVVFFNTLNNLYYNLDSFLKSNRNDMYYCSLWILSNKSMAKKFLFPSCFITFFDFDKANENSIQFISDAMCRSLKNISKYYYIETQKFNYNNSQSKIHHTSDREKFLNFLSDALDASQMMFLCKTSYTCSYEFTDNELKMVDTIIDTFKNNQKTRVKIKKENGEADALIKENVEYVIDYCKQHNYKIKEFAYTPKPLTTYIPIFLEFFITYNNYDYKFSIKKFNGRYYWSVNLKNDRLYRINLYLKDDFKHIVHAMLED